MPRILQAELENALGDAGRRTTLEIILSDGTGLYFSTADTEVNDKIYLAKLAPVDDLNLDATQAVEGVNFKISNITLSFGRDLINNTDLLSGSAAVLGTYFFTDAGEWADEKLQGKITVGDIDGDWVNIFFEDITNTIWTGATIASLFPDEEIPAAELPQPAANPNPVYDDGLNVPGSRFDRDLSPLTGDYQHGGRYFLPDFQEFVR